MVAGLRLLLPLGVGAAVPAAVMAVGVLLFLVVVEVGRLYVGTHEYHHTTDRIRTHTTRRTNQTNAPERKREDAEVPAVRARGERAPPSGRLEVEEGEGRVHEPIILGGWMWVGMSDVVGKWCDDRRPRAQIHTHNAKHQILQRTHKKKKLPHTHAPAQKAQVAN